MAAAALVRSVPVSGLAATHGRRLPAISGHALLRWYDRYIQRCLLADLDDHMLADIGITRRRAEAEARKPFWR